MQLTCCRLIKRSAQEESEDENEVVLTSEAKETFKYVTFTCTYTPIYVCNFCLSRRSERQPPKKKVKVPEEEEGSHFNSTPAYQLEANKIQQNVESTPR